VTAAEQVLVAAVPKVVLLLDDSSADVRDSALGILERIGPPAIMALPRLQKLSETAIVDEAVAVEKVIRAISESGRS
jgi:hypothetical protein